MAKKTRTQAGSVVAGSFLPVEQAAQANAAESAKCLATLIEQRIHAQLPPHFGNDVLALVAAGVQHQVAAANAFADAHKRLAELRDGLGISIHGYGPDCEPDNVGFLTLVPAAA